MRLPAFISTIAAIDLPCCGPLLIAVGLAIQIAAVYWPAAPAVTAMALVALGATGATLTRFAGQPALRPLVAAHLFIYGGLYLLFVGAVLHAATTGPLGGTHLWACLDVAASIWPMAIAARWAIAAKIGRPRSEDATSR